MVSCLGEFIALVICRLNTFIFFIKITLLFFNIIIIIIIINYIPPRGRGKHPFTLRDGMGWDGMGDGDGDASKGGESDQL